MVTKTNILCIKFVQDDDLTITFIFLLFVTLVIYLDAENNCSDCIVARGPITLA